jgi:ribonuclease T2
VRPAITRVLLLAGLLLGAAPVLAQESRGAPSGTFDFYVLSLSWSSGFCAVEGDQKQREECNAGSGKGFVVHGLWPQYERGFPSFCEPGARSAPRYAIEGARDVFPSGGLAQYQWRKHGTCSGLDPVSYFRTARTARAKVKVPPGFEGLSAEKRMAPIEIERAFIAANPGLRAEAMSVQCERSILEEVRVCIDRDLRTFRTCPEVDRRRCRASEVIVPPVR